MTRIQLEHLIRAAADIADDEDIVVTYGYYAQGVSETTACLPRGWKERLVVVQNENTRGARGLCLDVYDLLASKALAGREKDIDFLSEAARHRLAQRDGLLNRLRLVDAGLAEIERAQALVRRLFADQTQKS